MSGGNNVDIITIATSQEITTATSIIKTVITRSTNDLVTETIASAIKIKLYSNGTSRWRQREILDIIRQRPRQRSNDMISSTAREFYSCIRSRIDIIKIITCTSNHFIITNQTIKNIGTTCAN